MIVIVLVLVLDQWLKFWVKTNMLYGESNLILGIPWARLHFVENPGMAFGITFWGDTGKLLLSLFRIAAIIGLSFYIAQLLKKKAPWGVLFSFSLILAGAIGNILDSAFYGIIFSESYRGSPLAVLFPPEGGYSSFLHGKVVDMLYFPLFQTVLPDWLPIWGGKPFQFFRPVFNLADAAISFGVFYLLLFHRAFFATHEHQQKSQDEESIELTSDDDQPIKW